ncbi:transglutaminase domain-containing protein [Bacillus pseudomycoides]|uniref:transglutaminase domain-containing protein n=1 Tax=Bacillus pseudomycoides TaxID=64104 RepID=UPI003D216298
MKQNIKMLAMAVGLTVMGSTVATYASADTGWKQTGSVWNYYNVNGAKQTGWQSINGAWYYFNGSGAMQTGWQSINGAWYYFNGSGAMQTGWQSINGAWYYFNGSGAMQADWQSINGAWYYFNGSGVMQTDWQSINGAWYYFNGSGAMQTNWQSINGAWYYFNGSGAMQTDWQSINGAWYYFSGSGAMQTGWIQDNGKKYYFESNGVWNPNAENANNVSRPDGQLLDAFQNEIKKHINNQEENITMTYKSKNSNINEVMDTLVKEYDKAVESNEYLNYNIANTQYSIRGIPGNYTFTLKITYRESKEQTNYVKTQAKSIINSIVQAGMDEHEKVKAIHDYVVKHVSYDTSFQAYTAYEALANRSAVCQGYALLTYQLLKEAGIENHIVTGTGNGQPHAWNQVKIEGKWYHLDTTFDDPIPDVQGRVTYSYYNLSDAQIAQDHQWDRNKFAAATTNYTNELANKIQSGSSKSWKYQDILKAIKR